MLERMPDLEIALYEVLRESFIEQDLTRTGLHLTALLNPRQTYWRNLDPRPLTNAEIGFFSAGRGHEDAVAKMLVQDFIETPEATIDGIHLRPDFQAISDRIIPCGEYAEFKTRRSNLPKSDEEANDPQRGLTTYRDQIRRYMALKRRTSMYLIVLSLTEGKTRDPLSTSAPVYAVYKETMTTQELIEERSYLISMRILLQSPAGAQQMPLCWEFLCGKWHKALVRDGGTWSYIPRCPYYENCKPWETDPQRGYVRS
jgi:hypothetical protein